MKTPVISTLRGVLCVLVAVCAITASHADEKPKKEKKIPAKVLQKYDVNQDGILDEQEKAAWDADKAKKAADAEAKRLKKYDANGDGMLDESELEAEKAAKAAAAAKKKEAAAKKKAEKEAAANAAEPAPSNDGDADMSAE